MIDDDLSKLNYSFLQKPLLIGGKAKEYYGLRESGDDIDFVISNEDYQALSKKYPNNIKDLSGDLGIKYHSLELWRSISWFEYDYLKQGATNNGDYLIISLEKLLFLTALAMKTEKYQKDLELIVNKIIELQYEKGPPE